MNPGDAHTNQLRQRSRRWWIVLTVMIATILTLFWSISGEDSAAQISRNREGEIWVEALGISATYVDEKSCVECHAAQVVEHEKSAHARTTSWPEIGTVSGKFEPPHNVMQTADPGLEFIMALTTEGYSQTARWTLADGRMQTRQESIDVVVGSGRKGQTYLYWQDDHLFELPVSWWSETDEWMNSPGYQDGTARFDRGSSDRCLECHATSFVSRGPPHNRFDPKSLQLGISCQKCHGPASEHISLMRAEPSRVSDLAVVNPARLSRQRQMDMCALCHGGVGQAHTPALSFMPGDVLARHIALPPPPATGNLDVHGSQVQALVLSACYKNSPTMTCNTCHGGHETQRNSISYAIDCRECHIISTTIKGAHSGENMETGCVDCHMPLQATTKINLSINGRLHRPKVRNHTIGIY